MPFGSSGGGGDTALTLPLDIGGTGKFVVGVAGDTTIDTTGSAVPLTLVGPVGADVFFAQTHGLGAGLEVGEHGDTAVVTDGGASRPALQVGGSTGDTGNALEVYSRNFATLTLAVSGDNKLGFFAAAPAARPAAIADAAGGATIDAQARTALNGLLAAVRLLGLIAT